MTTLSAEYRGGSEKLPPQNLEAEEAENWEARFWRHVDKQGDPEACWTWMANGLPCKGYGQFWKDGKGYAAHRTAWELKHGPIPPGIWVLHNCDNPSCVRDEHLFLGTLLDNVRDMCAKRRQATGKRQGTHTHPESRSRGDRQGTHTHPECIHRGENNGMSKLTVDQVCAIRSAYIPYKNSCARLARQYGVDQSLIWQIIKRKAWAFVGEVGNGA